MRVALLTQHYAPHFEGGTEAVVRAQARELRRMGHDVRVVAGTDRAHAGRDVEVESVDGIPVAFLPRREGEFYDVLLNYPRIEALAAEIASTCDLAHVHHWSTLGRALVRTLAERVPVVVTLHDLFVTCPRFFRTPQHGVEVCPPRGELGPCVDCVAPELPSVPRPKLLEGFQKRVRHFQAELDAARVVVVPSASHRRRLSTHVDVDEERFVVVPHGLCVPIERPPLAAWDGDGPLRVLFLGHRAAVKGLLELARALAALPAALRARVELVTLGQEVEDGFDERLRAAAGSVTVVHHGPYAITELADRLVAAGGAHLAALPSRVEESYGLVVDEALALGLPVWVSDRGAPPERVGDAGRVLPAEDVAAWTRAFAEVLADPAVLARERAAVPDRPHTAADAVRQLDALYATLLSPAP